MTATVLDSGAQKSSFNTDTMECRQAGLCSTDTGEADMATATTEPVRLPPGPRIPKPVQGVAFLASKEMYAALCRRYGSAISVNLPGVGYAVLISDPILAKDLFSTSTDLIERPTSGPGALGQGFGPGSLSSLVPDRHLAPPQVCFPGVH